MVSTLSLLRLITQKQQFYFYLFRVRKKRKYQFQPFSFQIQSSNFINFLFSSFVVFFEKKLFSQTKKILLPIVVSHFLLFSSMLLTCLSSSCQLFQSTIISTCRKYARIMKVNGTQKRLKSLQFSNRSFELVKLRVPRGKYF